jgi:hypothetical protein
MNRLTKKPAKPEAPRKGITVQFKDPTDEPRLLALCAIQSPATAPAAMAHACMVEGMAAREAKTKRRGKVAA